MNFVIALIVGVIFGTVLQGSKVSSPKTIFNQLLFKKFIMLKVMITAMLTSMVVIACLVYFGYFELQLRGLNLYTNLLGGGLLGAGIALARACPGTVFAQIGARHRGAWATFAGGFTGALVYGLFNKKIDQFFSFGSLGEVRLDQVFGVSATLIGIGFFIVGIGGLFFLEKKYPWQTEISC
ncbi:MAG: hypothetical protein RLZ12_40 [Bacillota bacterium]|jgi:cytochrome bd-type quinol oxidase subunit 2